MRKLRLLLFPLAGIYYLATLTRNKLYDEGFFESKKYPLPVICVGNLSVGGTGKTPMTEFIIRLLKEDYKIATLSRGYGRKTTGYIDVTTKSLAIEVGDEPLQFAHKFNEIQVAVCEDRQVGIEKLLAKRNPPDVILLDDAHQHRKVVAGLYMLLTSYSDLYSNDFMLPAGNLREWRGGADRADIIIVTKCPVVVSKEEQEEIKNSLDVRADQSIHFSKIVYDEQVYSQKGAISLNSLKVKKVSLVTGIANPKPLTNYLEKQGLSFTHKSYDDHHNFSTSEIAELENLDCILTTEKDYVRLRPLLKMKQLYYQPIEVKFLNDNIKVSDKIRNFISTF